MAQLISSGSIHKPNVFHGDSPSLRSPFAGKLFEKFVLPVNMRSHKRQRGFVQATSVRSKRSEPEILPAFSEDMVNFSHDRDGRKLVDTLSDMSSRSTSKRKTKIVCTIGPSTNTREMIWKLAEVGMNVARMNMSHGDHASHKKVIDLVREYNAQSKDNVIAIMLDTKGPEVRSGDLPQPITLIPGQEFTFTIKSGVGSESCVSVNYDDFVNDVEVGDMLLVDGGMMPLLVKSKTEDSVKCEVIDGGELKSRRHLNVRGKSATLPSITAAVIGSFPEFFRDKYMPDDNSVLVTIAKLLRPVVLSLILCASHGRTFSLLNGYSAPLTIYKHLEYHDDVMPGSVVCVGSEWHRYPSSFFIPSYVSEVRWIDDGFRGLLPFPFNSTLGGTAAAPPYFNNKNKASDEQYLRNVEACTFLVELDLRRPYPTRGSNLSTWEVVAALPYLDRELSPAKYRAFFIPYLWQEKNVFGLYKLLRRIGK